MTVPQATPEVRNATGPEFQPGMQMRCAAKNLVFVNSSCGCYVVQQCSSQLRPQLHHGDAKQCNGQHNDDHFTVPAARNRLNRSTKTSMEQRQDLHGTTVFTKKAPYRLVILPSRTISRIELAWNYQRIDIQQGLGYLVRYQDRER
jgi:hypothetical protein